MLGESLRAESGSVHELAGRQAHLRRTGADVQYETARLELEFAARGIALILKHYTPLSDDVRIDLQDLADDILRRLNRESNLRSN